MRVALATDALGVDGPDADLSHLVRQAVVSLVGTPGGSITSLAHQEGCQCQAE